MTVIVLVAGVVVTGMAIVLIALLAVACHELQQLRARVVDHRATLEAIRLALVDIDRALGAVARAIEDHGTAPIDISAMVMSIEHEDQLASAVGRALNRRRN